MHDKEVLNDNLMVKKMADGGIFVYVSNADSKEIFVLRLDLGSGELTLLQKISVTGRVMPIPVAEML